jgi:predicted porin
MRRSAIFLTVAGLALPLSASAQDAQFSVYGTLLPFVDNFHTTGATAPGLTPQTGGASQVIAADYTGEDLPNRFRVTSGTSNIGFRGELAYNEHLKAWFQVECATNPDGDISVYAAPWASRNSAVGLKGDWGTLFWGQWDTPYYYAAVFVGPLRGLNPFDNAVTGNPGFNVPVVTTQGGRATGRFDAVFIRRQGNSAQYWTPTWRGLSARLMVGLNESRTRASATEPGTNPWILSALASYDFGPLSVRYAYQMHLDYFGLSWLGGSPGVTFTNPSSRDDGHEIVAWVKLPTGTRVAGIAERLTYRTDEMTAGLVNSYQRDAILGAVQQRIGAHTLWGSIGFAQQGRCTMAGGAPCSTSGLDGRQWSVGYTYSPAKTVDIYAAFYELANGRSGSHATFPPVASIAPGSTTRGGGVGILYMFDFTTQIGGPKPPPAAPATPPEQPAAPPAQPPAPPPGDSQPPPPAPPT